MKKFFLAPLLCLMVSSCAWAEGFVRVAATGIAVNVRAEADAEGLYCVVGRELPILEKPLSPMPDTEYLDELEGIDGVIVYGNHVELRPAADGWFELMSPYDGSVLGYIPKKGLERVPDYEHAGKTGKKYFMANGDGPELSLQPGKGGDGYSLSSYGYSLAKGEVVKSVGSRSHAGERWLLLEFDTDYSGGSSGVGARYAWSPEKNFTDLSAYKPDNSRVDERSLPSKMRYGADALNPGDGQDEMKKGVVDFLPVTKDLRAALLKKGFQAGPAWRMGEYDLNVDDMADYYSFSGQYQADFITTDIFLHSFHLIFDHALQKFERTYLAPALETSLENALESLTETKRLFSSGDNADVYETARDMLLIPLALLDEKPEKFPSLSSRASGELRRIIAAKDVTGSEVTGQKLDYTLFAPRGHYTLRPELERYFRAVSWLGSAELALFDEDGDPIPHNLSVTALISLALEKKISSWDAFEAPVNFLVGAPNTGGSEPFRALAKKYFGSLDEAAGALSDASALSKFAADIKTSVPGPMIQSAPGGDVIAGESGARSYVTDFASRAPVFRVSSKRFTYDAYVFNMLTSPRVGTDEKPRNLPEGTDLMAVLGSKAADGLAAKNNDVKGYAENMKKLKAGVDKYLAGDGTVYSAWIAALKSGLGHSGADQFFYNSPAWQWKKLSTQSASWAELKHDTILYADQSGAEMGDGGEYAADPFAPPYPRGYVEPDPQTFDSLLSATARLADFIKKFGMEPEDEDYQTEGRSYTSKLEEFTKLLTIARDIAKKEAEGEGLTIDDYASIKGIARSFNSGLLLPGERAPDREQLKMALAADVASDYLGGRILEVASGRPQRIFVYVNDASGGARITRGFIFSYYEFTRPLSDGRMTDEEWKKLVYDEDRTDELKKYHPEWYEKFLK